MINAQVSEENHVRPDTTIQTIIYEYDTVYIAPDTVKLTDTIINYLPAKKNIKNHPWSVGISVSPFVPNAFNEKNSLDSFSLQRTVNYRVALNLQYDHKNFIYSIGFGITPLHERIHYQGSLAANTQQQLSVPYDSLSINRNCTADNYFNYLNVYLTVGKKWVKRKIYYAITASIIADFLLDYKAFLPVSNQDNQIKASSVRKFSYATALSPYMGYRFGKKLELYIAPFYRYTINKKNNYPLNNLNNLGIGAGLNLIL